MLAGVLLHVIEQAAAVDAPGDRGPGRRWRGTSAGACGTHPVPEKPGLVDHVDDGKSGQQTGVVRLPPRRGVECGPVEPEIEPRVGGAHLQQLGIELEQGGVFVEESSGGSRSGCRHDPRLQEPVRGCQRGPRPVEEGSLDDFPRFETPIRVRYSETDQMGHAYYANYLIWFEAARGHFMRELGLPYGRLEQAGFLLPVTRFSARLVRPARYDDDLRVRLWIPRARSRLVEFVYHVMRDDERLAEGTTQHVSIDRAGRPVRLPQEAMALLTAWQERWPAPRYDYDPS